MVQGLFRDLKKAQLWALLGEGKQLVPSFWYPEEEFFFGELFLAEASKRLQDGQKDI